MLGKCSLSPWPYDWPLLTALAGVFAPEGTLSTPDAGAEPNSEFTVGELKSEVETHVQRLDPDVSIEG